jgi:type VI secretion system secreted protein VgrG
VSDSDSPTPSGAPSIDGGHGTIPVLGTPDIVLSSAADIASLTPANTVMSAEGCTTVTASQDINMLAQRHHAWAVKDGISLFTRGESKDSQRAVQDTGMKFHAASGNVNVQAQSGPVSVTAQQAVDVQSTGASVTISAPMCIVLNGGGGYIKLEGGDIEIGTSGPASFLASLKILEGGADASSSSMSLKKTAELQRFNEAFIVKDEETGEILPHVRYRIEDASGNVLALGTTDEQGRTGRVHTASATQIKLFILDN